MAPLALTMALLAAAVSAHLYANDLAGMGAINPALGTHGFPDCYQPGPFNMADIEKNQMTMVCEQRGKVLARRYTNQQTWKRNRTAKKEKERKKPLDSLIFFFSLLGVAGHCGAQDRNRRRLDHVGCLVTRFLAQVK
jgi:hypothetical protein